MSRRKKKKKESSVTFELVVGRDENGNLVQHFVPKKINSKKTKKSQGAVNRILSKFSVDEEDDTVSEKVGISDDVKAMMIDYDEVKKELSKEERMKFSVDGMFPDDGYDYSRFVIEESELFKDVDGKRIQKKEKKSEEIIEEVETFEEEAWGEEEEDEYYEEEEYHEEEGEYTEKDNGKVEDDMFENAETILEEEYGEDNVEEEDDDDEVGEKGGDSIFDLFFGGKGGTEANIERTETPNQQPKGRGRNKKKKAIYEKPLQSKALTEEQKLLNLAFKESISKLDSELFGDEFDDEFGEGNVDEQLQLELELEAEGEDEENEGEEGDEDGGLSFKDIEHVLDDFIKVQETNNVVSYQDADHQTDGKVSLEDQEKYSKFAPEGMYLLNESMRRKLRSGDIDRKEMEQIMLNWMRKQEGGESDDEEMDESERYRGALKKRERDRFDCESIISTYSNVENRPTLIKDEKKTRKRREEEEEEEESVEERIFKLNRKARRGKNTSIKSKGRESKDIKKKRKKEVKKLRKQKRMLKKQLKGKYRSEIIKRRNLEAGELKNKQLKYN